MNHRSLVCSALIACCGFAACFVGSPALAAESAVITATEVADLPKAEDLFKKHIEAIGGEKALAAVNNRIIDGMVERASSQFLARLTIWQSKPNKILVLLEQPGLANIEIGFDGTTSWASDPRRGVRHTEGQERDQVLDSAFFWAEADFASRYSSMETVGEVEFNKAKAYKVRAQPKHGFQTMLFFDVQSGLVIGSEVTSPPGPDGKPVAPTITVIGEYKKFGDVLYATRTVQTQQGQQGELVTVYRNVENNPEKVREIKAPPLPANTEAQGATPPAAAAPASAPASAPAPKK